MWHVGGVPTIFENIGFTRKVAGDDEMDKKGLKWLICAECDLGERVVLLHHVSAKI